MDFPNYERDYKPKDPAYVDCTRMVPIEKLDPYKEYNWTRENNRLGGPSRWDHLKDSIQREGIFWPMIFMYNPHNGHGYLGEGNHRLQIAKELGMTHVPVRIMKNRTLNPGDHNGGVKPVPGGPIVPENSYFPSDSDPEEVFPKEWFGKTKTSNRIRLSMRE